MTSSFLPPNGTNFGSFGDYSGLGGSPTVNFQGSFDTPSTFNAPNLGVAETFGGGFGGGLVGDIFQSQAPGQSVGQATEIATPEPSVLDYIRAIGPAAAGISDIVNAFKGRPSSNFRAAGQRLGGYYKATDSRGATESRDSLIENMQKQIDELKSALRLQQDVTATGDAPRQGEQPEAGLVMQETAEPMFRVPGVSADPAPGIYNTDDPFRIKNLPDLSGLNIPRI
jgi:hypothetical protein